VTETLDGTPSSAYVGRRQPGLQAEEDDMGDKGPGSKSKGKKQKGSKKKP
jgi:hypothetical protein